MQYCVVQIVILNYNEAIEEVRYGETRRFYQRLKGRLSLLGMFSIATSPKLFFHLRVEIQKLRLLTMICSIISVRHCTWASGLNGTVRRNRTEGGRTKKQTNSPFFGFFNPYFKQLMYQYCCNSKAVDGSTLTRHKLGKFIV